ncbi:hypothetical protein PILCRDRAFT_99252 [Piloderma croceum F 1598]|uniref:Phospholipase n=1 Tax=Piloderma croceum (strain F 1598) TaxID=765440 RepID=A0A0C3AIU8_PILCF|nr:hypothetical protein PILCRDRAFT_99252 [Piloderma croceum F 1598]
MSSFFSKISELAQKADKVDVSRLADKVYDHARDEIIGEDHFTNFLATPLNSCLQGFVNPNRRHDEPEEIMDDKIREEINNSHRFNSFADRRFQNFVKWHVDGHDYMYAVSEMLQSAKHAIFILDWWLTPELYLRRPPAYNEEWRLDRLLKRKAEEGVKIYVVVYKEVTQTMSMSSHHTKSALEALHPNIACMRHPDHIGSKDTVEFWSHHEVVVVDNHRACIGGLDLCFGRFDTHTHPLADVHPTHFARTLFPGQDYNNARVLDFQDVPNYVSNAVSIMDTARMPWHDVHMTLEGTVVLDIVQHFVERWNEIKKRKACHPHLEHWHKMGRQFRQRFYLKPGEEIEPGYSEAPHGTCRVQAVRSVSDWSQGVLTEHSVQNAYRELIRKAEKFIYIGIHSISNTKVEGPVKNLIAQALVERIVRAAKAGAKFKVIVVIPELPGFAGNIKDQSSLKTIMAAQYRTMNRGGSSIYEEVRKAGFEPTDYIRFYHLRSYDRINAPYKSFISKMEANSGVRFHEAQIALAREWIGDQADAGGVDPITEVYIKIPQPTNEGIVESRPAEKVEKVKLPASEKEARELIARFEHGADNIRGDEEVADTVSQHMLNDTTELMDEKWLGTEEEERDAYVSELLYIHSKVMIIDDRTVIMGSANLNDRSQKGDGDSEIALVVEDEDVVDSTMDGEPFQVARFATTLRRQLFREHLGLISPQDCSKPLEQVTSFMRCAPVPNEDNIGDPYDLLVADPLAEATQQLWNDTARKNREIFTEVFRPVPTNLVRNWDAYDAYLPKVKTGHVVPEIPLQRVKDRLSLVRGSVVECPLDFLIDEKDFVEGPDWIGLNPTLPIYI